jgi:hypothetical protein
MFVNDFGASNLLAPLDLNDDKGVWCHIKCVNQKTGRPFNLVASANANIDTMTTDNRNSSHAIATTATIVGRSFEATWGARMP